MKILITNDDSISAKQLLPLIKYCKKFGEVTTVVPKFEQSGKSHGIELHCPFTVDTVELEEGITAYAVDSTPADCVRFALHGLNEKYDLIVSGINRGYNMGTDVMYSGTVAAAREGAYHNIISIAVSTCPEYYENAIEHLDSVVQFVVSRDLLSVHRAYNINIPPQPKGIKITKQGRTYYTDRFEKCEDGKYALKGECLYQPTGDLSLDTDSVVSGYISIMPLSINMTDLSAYDKLTKCPF